jgi:transcriptional regulator with XRE-family HTH domain
MGGRERRVDRGAARSRAIVADLARELWEARLDRGLSQEAIGRAVGLSGAQVSRIERGMAPSMPVEQAGRLLAVVGLELSARAYPGGTPLRDAAHTALLGRFRTRLHRSLAWRTEVPLPLRGDPRAWDAVVAGPSWRLGVEAETRPRDAQALIRRISLKARDGGVGGIVLVIADTRHDRAFLRAASEDLAARFPADGRRALEMLGVGLQPEEDALILL